MEGTENEDPVHEGKRDEEHGGSVRRTRIPKTQGEAKKQKKKPAGGLRWLHRKSKEEWTAAADGYRRLLCAFCKDHATRRR